MVVQSNHLQKALNDLSSAYQRVAGDEYLVEDLEISLSILNRALADALQIREELLEFLQPMDISEFDPELKAHAGRIFAIRSVLLFELGHHDTAALSARFAIQALRETLDYEFSDEDRYAANYLHKLLTREVVTTVLTPYELGGIYESLFEYYRSMDLFDRAEDMLFHALHLQNDPLDLLLRGLAFYEELTEQETRYLQKRGLPRHEVNESRREIQEKIALHQ